MLPPFLPSPAPSKTIERQVLQLISKCKAIKAAQLRPSASLERDLHLDTLDVVDIILELERKFHLTVPDEVPFYTVSDFVRYVADHRTVA